MKAGQKLTEKVNLRSHDFVDCSHIPNARCSNNECDRPIHIKPLMIYCSACGFCKKCCLGKEGRKSVLCPNPNKARPKRDKLIKFNQYKIMEKEMMNAIKVAFGKKPDCFTKDKADCFNEGGVICQFNEDNEDIVEGASKSWQSINKALARHIEVLTKPARMAPNVNPALALIHHEPKLALVKTPVHNETILHAAVSAGRPDIVRQLVAAPYFCDPTARMILGNGSEFDPKDLAQDILNKVEKELDQEATIELSLQETQDKQTIFEDLIGFLDDLETFNYAIENAMTNGDIISVDNSLRRVLKMMSESRIDPR